jgi:hypothetical protein
MMDSRGSGASSRAGVHAKGSLRYDPVSDEGLSKFQNRKFQRAGLPSELITPTWTA